MEYKVLKKYGLNLRIYKDGRVYLEEYTRKVTPSKTKVEYERKYGGRFLAQFAKKDPEYPFVFISHKSGKVKSIMVHRLLAEAYLDDFAPNLEVDHIDGNKSNNDLSNLRMLTKIQNMRAARKPKRKGMTSKYLGVTFDKRAKKDKCYHSRIMFNYKIINLGYYSSEEKAALAYNKKAIELGFTKERLNVIEK